jgi:hypothetical protein
VILILLHNYFLSKEIYRRLISRYVLLLAGFSLLLLRGLYFLVAIFELMAWSEVVISNEPPTLSTGSPPVESIESYGAQGGNEPGDSGIAELQLGSGCNIKRRTPSLERRSRAGFDVSVRPSSRRGLDSTKLVEVSRTELSDPRLVRQSLFIRNPLPTRSVHQSPDSPQRIR